MNRVHFIRGLPHCVSFISVEDYKGEITLPISLIRTPKIKALTLFEMSSFSAYRLADFSVLPAASTTYHLRSTVFALAIYVVRIRYPPKNKKYPFSCIYFITISFRGLSWG